MAAVWVWYTKRKISSSAGMLRCSFCRKNWKMMLPRAKDSNANPSLR